MNLGERCDEIVRLIDETLAEVSAASRAPETAGATVTALPAAVAPGGRRSRRPTPGVERADRAAAGF
jgi:hypothetical protein